MHVIRWQELVPQPWKNGGGTTRQIYSEGRLADRFDWRVSVAEVEVAGEFSLFPGYERVIMPLSPHGMQLMHQNGLYAQLQPLVPFRFPGEIALSAGLPHGPVQDFNLIMRREFGQPVVELLRLDGKQTWQAPEGTLLIFAISGRMAVESSSIVLNERDSLATGGKRVSFVKSAGVIACGRANTASI